MLISMLTIVTKTDVSQFVNHSHKKTDVNQYVNHRNRNVCAN